MDFVDEKRSVIHSAAVVYCLSLSLSLGPSQKCISSEAWSSQVVCWACILNTRKTVTTSPLPPPPPHSAQPNSFFHTIL